MISEHNDDYEPFLCFVKELDRIRHEHRMLIIITSGFMELMLNAVIEKHCKNAKRISDSNRDYPLSVKTVLLHEMGLMSDETFKNMHWLRKIRNKAAHHAFFALADKDLLDIPSNNSPDKVHSICAHIMTTFWTEHIVLFYKLFVPRCIHELEESVKEMERLSKDAGFSDEYQAQWRVDMPAVCIPRCGVAVEAQ